MLVFMGKLLGRLLGWLLENFRGCIHGWAMVDLNTDLYPGVMDMIL